MRIRTETTGGRTVVDVAGRFDAHEVDAFRTVAEPLGSGGRTLEVRLADTVFLDSSALAELVRLHRAALAAGGDLRLVELSDPARVILEVTGLHDVLVGTAK